MIDPHRIRVLGPRLLVERDPTPEQSRGGLYVLGRDLPALGTVLAVGTKLHACALGYDHTIREPSTYEVIPGDTITYDKYHWGDLWVGGDQLQYFIVDLKHVFARLRRDPTTDKWLIKPLEGKVLVKRDVTQHD